MPTNPEIALQGVKPTEQANPLALFGQFSQMQQNINANKLFQQQQAARMQMGQIAQSSVDPATGQPNYEQYYNNIATDPTIAGFPEMRNQALQARQTQAQYEGLVQAQSAKALDQIQTGIASVSAIPQAQLIDPNSSLSPKDQIIQHMVTAIGPTLATTPDETKARFGKAIPSIIRSLTDNIPADPTQAYATFAGNTRGYVSQQGKDMQSAINPSVIMQDLGGKVTPLAIPAGGRGGPVQSLAGPDLTKTMSPGEQLQAGDPRKIGSTSEGADLYAPLGNNPLTAGMPPVPRSGNLLAMPTPAGAGQAPASAGQGKFDPSKAPLDPADYGAWAAQQFPKTTNIGQGPSPGTVDQAKNYAAYKDNLVKAVEAGQDQQHQMVAVTKLAQEYTPSKAAEFAPMVGSILRGFGWSSQDVDKAFTGNVGATEAQQNIALTSATSQLRTLLAGSGKITNFDMAQFLKANPSVATDPRGLVEIYNIWNNFANKDQSELKFLQSYEDKGDVTKANAAWAQSPYMKNFSPSGAIPPLLDSAGKPQQMLPETASSNAGGKVGTKETLDSIFGQLKGK